MSDNLLTNKFNSVTNLPTTKIEIEISICVNLLSVKQIAQIMNLALVWRDDANIGRLDLHTIDCDLLVHKRSTKLHDHFGFFRVVNSMRNKHTRTPQQHNQIAMMKKKNIEFVICLTHFYRHISRGSLRCQTPNRARAS